MLPQRVSLERRTWGGAFCGLLLLSAGLLSGCQSSSTGDRLHRFFGEIVFGSGDAYEGTSARVAKWTGPIAFHLAGADVETYEPEVKATLARFSALTGVTAVPASESAASLKIVLVPEESFPINESTSHHETVPCAASVESGERGIEQAMVRISVADKDLVGECVAHELMHAFGFRHHSGLVSSTLSPFHGRNGLTPWDEMALKVLYDPEVHHNARRSDVMPIARRRISAFVSER